MDRRGKVPLEIEKVIKRQEVTETDMERGRFFGDIAEMRLTVSYRITCNNGNQRTLINP